MITAYDLGKDAFEFRSLSDNPFSKETENEDYKEWRRGWKSAKRKFDGEMKALDAVLDRGLKDLKAGKKPTVTIDISELLGRSTKS